MKTHNGTVKFNKNVIFIADAMNNLMISLHNSHLIYFYEEARPQMIKDVQVIMWNNHESSRANCGSAFTSLEQYSHILNTGAFHCILFDGSIIRASFTFADNILIRHSHLWWPAPYIFESPLTGEITPQIQYEDFLTDPKWIQKVRMRSPVRIDYDPKPVNKLHPLTHMHTQHHETRVEVDKPICFCKFIKYIFQNYYPNIALDSSKWPIFNFSYSTPNVSIMSKCKFSKVII